MIHFHYLATESSSNLPLKWSLNKIDNVLIIRNTEDYQKTFSYIINKKNKNKKCCNQLTITFNLHLSNQIINLK